MHRRYPPSLLSPKRWNALQLAHTFSRDIMSLVGPSGSAAAIIWKVLASAVLESSLFVSLFNII